MRTLGFVGEHQTRRVLPRIARRELLVVAAEQREILRTKAPQCGFEFAEVIAARDMDDVPRRRLVQSLERIAEWLLLRSVASRRAGANVVIFSLLARCRRRIKRRWRDRFDN